MNEKKHFEKHAILKNGEELKINFIPFVSSIHDEVKRYFYEVGVIFDLLAAKRGLPNFVKDKDRKFTACLKEYAYRLGIHKYVSDREYGMIRECSWSFDIPVRAAVYMWGYYRDDFYALLNLTSLIYGIKKSECVLQKVKGKGDIFSIVNPEEIQEQEEEQEEK